MIRLRDLDRCFQGDSPAAIATCSPEGIPNVTHLSIVHRLDDAHVALSFQFFNKTRANILAHPRAQLLVPDPATFEQYRVDLQYVRTEQSGPLFERMRTNLEAVASQTRMTAVFRLQGVDVYRVLGIEKLARDLDLTPPEGSADFLAALATLSARLADCADVAALLEATVSGLAELFDHPASMILVPDGAGRVMRVAAAHGVPEAARGAVVEIGAGLIGIAARDRRPVRMVRRHFATVMADAVRTAASEAGHELEPAAGEPALPGLPDVQSQVAVPILARDLALGVLCVQSATPGRLTTADETALATVARHLATAMLLLGAAPPRPRDTEDDTAAPAPTGPTDPRPALIGGRYQVLGHLGAGGMGSVFRVLDTSLREVVALKFLRAHLHGSAAMLERFRQEVRIARRVTHRNVARTFDIGEHDGEAFLTMEYVNGEPLSSLLAREGPLPATRVAALGAAICDGLDAAHAAGVIHRDLKLDNVLIERGGRVVLTDFGIARAPSDAADGPSTAGVVGTPAYMAPEQVEGRRDLDGRADLYALGAVLFELATGEPAWPGTSSFVVATARLTAPPPDPRAHRPELPDALATLIVRCLARDPEGRPAGSRVVADALRAVAS